MTKIIQDSDIDSIEPDDIVLAGGCFDILHPGHVAFIDNAKATGRKLVVLLESDENINKLKGKGRPLNTQIKRAEQLAQLESIDYIVLLTMPTNSEYYYNLVKLLHPAIIAVTQGDPLLRVKEEQARLVGGKVVEVMQRDERYSTSALAKL